MKLVSSLLIIFSEQLLCKNACANFVGVSEILCKWVLIIQAPYLQNAEQIGSGPFPSLLSA